MSKPHISIDDIRFLRNLAEGLTEGTKARVYRIAGFLECTIPDKDINQQQIDTWLTEEPRK